MLLLWEKALSVTATHSRPSISACSIQYIAHLWHYITALPLYHAPKQRLPKQFEQIFSSFAAHQTKPAFWCWCDERAWRISSPMIKDKLDPYSVLKRALQRKTGNCASSNTSLHQCHQQTKSHECFHCGWHKQPASSKEHPAGRDASHHTKKVAKCMAQSSSSVSQKQVVNHSFPSPLRSIISLMLCHQLPIGNTSNLNIPNSSTS